mmetsp:Transcript_21547/g.41092  ORF Transcript_21547/g.41092 Transcript_21547/m.41092 type:complete len:544 (-) Transcript_21547:118-1749(-)
MAPRALRVICGRFSAAISHAFSVDRSQVDSRFKAALCPLVFARSRVLQELRVQPDLYSLLWIPTVSSFTLAFGHPRASGLPSYFRLFAWGLVLLYAYVLITATLMWMLLRLLMLRGQVISMVSICAYACVPWGVWCGVLFHRQLPTDNHTLPWRECLIALSWMSSVVFLTLGAAQHALVDRPDLSIYRSRAMAVLRLEASLRASPLPSLKAAAGGGVGSGFTLRSIVLGLVFLLFAAAVNTPLAFLMHDHLTGSWGSAESKTRLYFSGDVAPPAPEPPAFVKVTDIVDLHGQYVKNMMRLKSELSELRNRSSNMQASHEQVAEISSSIANTTLQRANEERQAEMVELQSKLDMVLEQLQHLQSAMVPPPPRTGASMEGLIENKEDALEKAKEIQEALLWVSRRKAERRRSEGAGEMEMIKLEKEVMMLKREKDQMENEARYRQFQKDPLGTTAQTQYVKEQKRLSRTMRGRARPTAKPPPSTSISADDPQYAGEGKIQTERIPTTRTTTLHGGVPDTTTFAISSKQQRTAELLRKLGNSIRGQ